MSSRVLVSQVITPQNVATKLERVYFLVTAANHVFERHAASLQLRLRLQPHVQLDPAAAQAAQAQTAWAPHTADEHSEYLEYLENCEYSEYSIIK